MSVIHISENLTAGAVGKESIETFKVQDVESRYLEAARKGTPKIHVKDRELYIEKSGGKPQDEELLYVAVITVRGKADRADTLRTYAGFAQQNNVPDGSYLFLYCPPGKIREDDDEVPRSAKPVVEDWETLRTLLVDNGGANIVKD